MTDHPPQVNPNLVTSLNEELRSAVSSIKLLAEDVKKDTVALVELRTELTGLIRDFTSLSKLVRNGSGTSILHRLTVLEERVQGYVTGANSTKGTYRQLVFIVIAALTGAFFPSIMKFIYEVMMHVAPGGGLPQ